MSLVTSNFVPETNFELGKSELCTRSPFYMKPKHVFFVKHWLDAKIHTPTLIKSILNPL